jgi:hypothetical protein
MSSSPILPEKNCHCSWFFGNWPQFQSIWAMTTNGIQFVEIRAWTKKTVLAPSMLIIIQLAGPLSWPGRHERIDQFEDHTVGSVHQLVYQFRQNPLAYLVVRVQQALTFTIGDKHMLAKLLSGHRSHKSPHRKGRRLGAEHLEDRRLLATVVFDTELVSLDLGGGPYPLPLASDPGNTLFPDAGGGSAADGGLASIEGYGFVDAEVSITLSSQRPTDATPPGPGPPSLGIACATDDPDPVGQRKCFPDIPPVVTPIDPAELDGKTFHVDSFFDVFFDITVTDVDSRPGRDFAGQADGASFLLPDNGPASMSAESYLRDFDQNAPNFGLIPPPEVAPYIGHFQIEIPLGADINGNVGECLADGDPAEDCNDKIKFTIASHAAGDENRTFTQLPDGTVLDEFDSAAFLEGAIVDERTDPPFTLGAGDKDFPAFTGPGALIGPTTATSKLLNPITAAGPPQVTAVRASSTAWAGSFTTAADPVLGVGYPIPTGSAQLDPLPWVNIDTVHVTFSEDVGGLSAGDVELRGVNVLNYAIGPISYNSATLTASIPLATANSPLGSDKLRLVVKDTVTDLSGDLLDGEWTDQVSTVSGDSVAGGDFEYRFNVLPGDVDQSASVFANDAAIVLSRQLTAPGGANYSIFADVDGGGSIFANDAAQVLSRQLTFLPAGSPAAEVMAVAPATDTAPGAGIAAEDLASPAYAAADVRDAAFSNWSRSEGNRLIDGTNRLASSRPQAGSTDDSPEVTDDVWRTSFD